MNFTLQFLPENQFYIFRDLRIKDSHGFFQMDTFILSTYYALIIEVKNIYGTIDFDRMGQTIRTRNDGTIEGFQHPLSQVNIQRKRLKSWLTANNFQPFPIENLVVYTNPRTILNNSGNNTHITDSIIKKEHLLTKMDTFTTLNYTSTITQQEIKRLSDSLLRSHTDTNQNVMEALNITNADLIYGVICPRCEAIPMVRNKRKWHCTTCGIFSHTAHEQALVDYQILFGDMINNRQARTFLHLNSSDVTKRLLKKSKATYEGTTSDRVYKLSMIH